jgi:superfamily II DNA or RNA helicase/HKD family nuclease
MVSNTLELQKSLMTGFVDKNIISNHSLQPELLVNNGKGNTVAAALREQLQQCDSFWFSVAFVTTSGVACLKQELIELESKNIKSRILVSQYLDFTQPEALKQLLKFSNIELRIATDSDFHAKGYLFSRNEVQNLIIGSSNFTSKALMTNKEWNLKVACGKQSSLFERAVAEFETEFNKSTLVTPEFIDEYQVLYSHKQSLNNRFHTATARLHSKVIEPNVMQVEAIENLIALRASGATKALLISATGTGKTFLSAFDAASVNPGRLLFIVHRANIAKSAMKSFESIFGDKRTYGLYSGDTTEIDKDFIFSTVQTLSRDDHLSQFDSGVFDYIVIDETHRASAASYQKILSHFNAKFILGMTATPERTDGDDVFKIFDHNIAYEIRLQKALEMNILSPFHYYGITDVTIDGNEIDDRSTIDILVHDDRVRHILDKIDSYGCDNGIVRGLVFCSDIKECEALSRAFNENGRKSVALTGKHSESQRDDAIERLESDNLDKKIDYIFTVGIFNEGIDIPSVNQIVLLRSTESSIIFIQQLGRGLRKSDGKSYLTVIDFIGNYKNNFLVPIALYGDNSYKKDTVRRLMSGRGGVIPGESTISFDSISKARIYKAIDSANLGTKRDLVDDYRQLKYKLGNEPLMMDFINHGSRDPFSYVEYSKSLFSFSESLDSTPSGVLSGEEKKLLEVVSCDINNGKRVGESIVLKELLEKNSVSVTELRRLIKGCYGNDITDSNIISFLNNLNLRFVTEKEDNKLKPVGEVYGFNVVDISEDVISWHPDMPVYLKNDAFVKYLKDTIEYSIASYNEVFKLDEFFDGFQLYKKYSRKDVFRILNWSINPVAQNVGGYIVSKDKTNCPIFVNYHKEDDISDTTKYEDHFINESEFSWMSKSKRRLTSPDVKAIREHESGLRLPLFIKKSNDEGVEFYYMGDVTPKEAGFEEATMKTEKGDVPVVTIVFDMKCPVTDSMYSYLLAK